MTAPLLIGMFDSPFVRRVAVTMELQGMAFEHRNWSVGKDAELIRAYNPLARVPALVLADGEVLIESSAILDYLDELAGPDHALLPASGPERRRALKLCALALGAVEKALMLVIERIFRPAEKRHEPWLARCAGQLHAAFAELEKVCAALPEGGWLLGPKVMQPDITLSCVATYARTAAGVDLSPYPALLRQVARSEALSALAKYYVPFHPPVSKG